MRNWGSGAALVPQVTILPYPAGSARAGGVLHSFPFVPAWLAIARTRWRHAGAVGLNCRAGVDRGYD